MERDESDKARRSGETDMVMDTDETLGEPPDKNLSWASKVAGGGSGGRPIPESVLSAEFVRDRMRLEFPDGLEGEPEVTIGEEVIEVMNGLWKRCLIVKVLSRNIAIPVLHKRLRELWQLKGEMSVVDLPRRFFLIRFELEDEYIAALTGGPWRIFGSHLMVQRWVPEFDPLRDEIRTTPVWVRVLNLPVNLYHEAILYGIGEGFGKPIKVDINTLNLERARFARICVEVNLSKPLKGSLKVNGVRYLVSYEGLNRICSGCGLYGHLIHHCPTRPVEEVAVPVISNSQNIPVIETEGQAIAGENDGFTEVRSQSRKHNRGTRDENLAGQGIGVDPTRNLRDISKDADMEGIVNTNRFAHLETDIISADSLEGVNRGEANKENVISNISSQDNVRLKKAGHNFNFGDIADGSDKRGDGPIMKKGPNMRNGGKGSKTKSSANNRPSRGLVFGAGTGVVDRTASGKRLRVENDVKGRSGGVFNIETHQSPTSLNSMPIKSLTTARNLEERRELLESNAQATSSTVLEEQTRP